MNDRFKFRFYDKNKKIMIDENSDYNLILGEYGRDEYWWCIEAAFPTILEHFEKLDRDFVIMQCTGLKDKNGKLIYEGDVVEFYSQSLLDALSRKGLARRVGQVIWNDEFLKFDVIVGSHAVPDLCKETDDNNFEVIGNIYENEDLLNENS